MLQSTSLNLMLFIVMFSPEGFFRYKVPSIKVSIDKSLKEFELLLSKSLVILLEKL